MNSFQLTFSKMRTNFQLERSMILALLASLCWMAQGMGQANFSNNTDLEAFLKHFPSLDSYDKAISPELKAHRSLIRGLVNSVYEIGMAFGGLSLYYLGDRLGRKKTVYLAAAVVMVGIAIEPSAYQVVQLYVGRIVAGLGIGAFTATVPAWVTETVSVRKRGSFVLLGGGFSITGIALISWISVGLVVHQDKNEIAWRFPIACQGILALIVTLATPILDESPRTLLRRGQREEAYKVMRKYRNEEELRFLEEEYQAMIQAYENELTTKDRNPWAFNEHKQFRRTMTSIILSGMCQMAGINLITFYGAQIFQNIGLSTVRSRVALAGLQTWQMVCAFAGVWFIARFGRRKLLLWGSAVMALCFACCAGLASSTSSSTQYAILAFDAIQLAAFPIGLFLNPFLIGSEIAGLLCRSAVLACSAWMHWILNFVLALVTPLGFNNIGYRYYIVYTCTNAGLFLFSYAFIPETSGLSVEEIDQVYVNSQSVLDIVECAEAVRSCGLLPPEVLLAEKDNEKGSVVMIEDVKAFSGEE
nr:MFS.14 [Starmerella bombicola]